MLNTDELVFVRDYLVKQLERTHQPRTTIEVAIALMDFEDVFKDGVSAMYRFINWMEGHGYSEDDILVGLVHDLNDFHSDGFSPRTSSY
jgi:hypothetical protein